MRRLTVFLILAAVVFATYAPAAEDDIEAGFRKPPADCRPTHGWIFGGKCKATIAKCPGEFRADFQRATADGGLSITPEEIRRITNWQALVDVSAITVPGLPARLPRQPYADAMGASETCTARIVYLFEKTKPVGGVFTQAKSAHGITIYPPAPTQRLFLVKRELGDAEVYFAVSQTSIDTVTTITFPRVAQPELWNPEDGGVRRSFSYWVRDKKTSLNLRLAPYQAMFIVLRKPATKRHVMSAPTMSITDVAPDGASVTGLVDKNGRCSVMFTGGKTGFVQTSDLPPPLPIADGWSIKMRKPTERGPIAVVDLRYNLCDLAEEKPDRWAGPDFDDSDWREMTIGETSDEAAEASEWRADWLGMSGNKQERFFRKSFKLPEDVDFAKVTITGDNGYELFVNGKRVGAELKNPEGWKSAETYDIAGVLHKGKNVFAARNTNAGAFGGILMESRIRLKSGRLMRVVTDGTWRTIKKAPTGWEQPDFDDESWGKPDVKGRPPVKPWGDVPGLPPSPTGGQVCWCRFELPAGTTSVKPPAEMKDVRLYVGGRKIPVQGGSAKLPKPASAGAVGVIRFVGLKLPETPVLCKTSAAAAAIGSWRLIGYPGYSGRADYTCEVDIPSAYAEEQLVLDLGEVACTAEVSVNGTGIGSRLWRPYEFDITDAAREGKNTIKVTVANTTANAAVKARDRNVAPGRLDSGILGPVMLRCRREITVKAQ